MLVQNILHFSSNECYFLCALSSTTRSLTTFPDHHFLLLTFIGDPRTRTTLWSAEHFTLLCWTASFARAAAFDQPSILYLTSASTPPILPPFRARSRFSFSCTRERPSPPCVSLAIFSTGTGAHLISRLMKHIYPNSLAMLAASAPPSLL